MEQNESEITTRFGGVEFSGELHSYSVWFILALRLMIGYAFLHSGIAKITASEPFAAQGYLMNVASTNGNPFEPVFHWIGTTPWMLDIVNIAVPWGEALIGIAVLLGAVTRLAAFFGAFMMLLFYFGNWSIEHGFVNGDFAYMLVFLSVAAFGAGRILGVDRYLEDLEVVEKYPQLKYLLG